MTWMISTALGKANWEICGSQGVGVGEELINLPHHICTGRSIQVHASFLSEVIPSGSKKGNSFELIN